MKINRQKSLSESKKDLMSSRKLQMSKIMSCFNIAFDEVLSPHKETMNQFIDSSFTDLAEGSRDGEGKRIPLS